jgi:hypothetical protein
MREAIADPGPAVLPCASPTALEVVAEGKEDALRPVTDLWKPSVASAGRRGPPEASQWAWADDISGIEKIVVVVGTWRATFGGD